MSLGTFNFSAFGRGSVLPEALNNVVRYPTTFAGTRRSIDNHSYVDQDKGELYLLNGTTFRKIILDRNNITTLVSLASPPVALTLFSGLPSSKGFMYGMGSNRTVYRYNINNNNWTSLATVGAHNLISGSNGYDMVDDITNTSQTDDCIYFKT